MKDKELLDVIWDYIYENQLGLREELKEHEQNVIFNNIAEELRKKHISVEVKKHIGNGKT